MMHAYGPSFSPHLSPQQCAAWCTQNAALCVLTRNTAFTPVCLLPLCCYSGTMWCRIQSFSSDLDDATYCQVGQDIKADLIILCFWKQANCTRERFSNLSAFSFSCRLLRVRGRRWHRLEPGQSAFRARLVPRRTAVTMSSLTSDTA